jgi:hypothetical protein
MKPLALNFAINRKAEIPIQYEYDFAESISIINVEGRKIPFIDANTADVLLLTKTKIHAERDDEDFKLLELATKTERSRERDDHHSPLLDLETKTFRRPERDDQ